MRSGDEWAGRVVTLHRLILRSSGVHVPVGMCVDHVNGDRLDNRTGNLRVVPYGVNGQNRIPLPGAVSRFRGVYLDKRRESGRWASGCYKGSESIRSTHDSEVEAAMAYDAAALQLYGPDAWTNARAGLFGADKEGGSDE